jgi:E3 ubiquitin-protein ligase TRIP12
LAEDFKKQGPKMWRETNDFSYFPKPFDPKQTDQKKITEELNAWKILGAICGRSILDERLFDMRFSEVFWKVVMGKKVGLADIGQMNDSLMKTLSDMQQLANQYQLASNKLIGKTSDEMEKVKKSLKYNGVPVEDLCLLFTLPGYDDYELLPQGNKKEVNLDSLELYVDLVTKIYLVDSILPYVEAFREGISMVNLHLT